MHVDVSEVMALARDIQRNADAVPGLARAAVAKNAYDVTATAQTLAPVDTGALKSSISADINDLSYEVGPTVEYGVYQEEGTSEMAAQPYLGPAFDQESPAIEDALGDIGDRAVSG